MKPLEVLPWAALLLSTCLIVFAIGWFGAKVINDRKDAQMENVVPLYASDSLDKNIARIATSVANVRGTLYVGNFDDEYTRGLERACKVEDKETRDQLVKYASDLKYEQRRVSEAYEALDAIYRQLVSLAPKKETP